MARVDSHSTAHEGQGGQEHAEGQGAAWQTGRADVGRGPSFSSRLILSFALTAVMTAALLVAVLGVVWEGQFQSYTRDNMERMASNTASMLARAYKAADGWGASTNQVVSAASAQASDVGIQVINANGTIIYDDTWPASAVVGEDGAPSVSLAPAAPESAVTAPVEVDGGRVGTVRVWAFGSDALLTKSDAAFRKNSYGAIRSEEQHV